MEVSVVLCTYSLEMYDHFREAAESVLDQTHDRVELVVIVDGSEEVYDRVVNDYDNCEDVVVHCNDENVGLLESRNTGGELASGDIVAFIDDDAIADETWVAELVRGYQQQNALAVGGKMVGDWVAGRPSFLPQEFYWLVGVTHRGFSDGAGWVRNTFGSNISFNRDVFRDLDGFDTEIGGRKGDANLQGGETELCARLAAEYDETVWYTPDAVVKHKIFDYRTKLPWLLDRAFWQGYSKRAMETLVPESGGQEGEFLTDMITEFVPRRVRRLARATVIIPLRELLMLTVFTGCVGAGYAYGLVRYR